MKVKLIALLIFTLAAIQFSIAQDIEYAKINNSLPLFINGNNAKDDVGTNVLCSSIISSYSPALRPSYSFNPGKINILNGRSYGFIYNIPVKKMFQILYGLKMDRDSNQKPLTMRWPIPLPNSKIMFDAIDSSKLVYFLNGARIQENCMNIQFTCHQDISEERVRKKMIADLETCFNVKTGWEKRRKKCMVIRKSIHYFPTYKEGKIDATWGDSSLQINGISMERFVALMGDQKVFRNSDYPIVDKTGFKGKLGRIMIDSAFLDYNGLKQELVKFGLELTIEERDVPVVVIRAAD